MHVTRKILALGLAAAAAAASPPAARADQAPPTLPGTRPLGMGNAFVAVADDRNAMHYNPAGLGRLARTHAALLGVRGGLDDDLPGVVRFIRDHEEEFGALEDVDDAFLEELAPYDDRWVGADAAVYADLSRPGFGIGVFATGQTQVKVDRGVYEPRVYETAISDIVGVIGGAMPLRGGVLAGATAKAIWRRQSTHTLTATEAADFDAQTILDELEAAEPGFSMDLGALWAPAGSRFAAGATLRDGFGWIGGERIDSALDVGGAWTVRRTPGSLLRNLLVTADVHDMSGNAAVGTKLHLGAEARFPLVSVRGGAHQGYGAVGASLHFPGVRLDWAYWGRELGRVPGAEDQFLHSVELRFGS